MSEELNRAQWERLYRDEKKRADELDAQVDAQVTMLSNMVDANVAAEHTVRELRERADELERELDAIPQSVVDAANEISAINHRLILAEHTVREQREVIEAAQELVNVWDRQAGNTALVRTVNMVAPVHGIRQAIAALAPNTEGEGT